MRSYPIPFNEAARLDALAALSVPGEQPDRVLDAIARMVRAMTAAECAMVTLVGAERQVYVARDGIAAAGSPREQAICAFVVAREAPLVIEDALADPVFADHPIVAGPPFARFYVGVPVRLSNRMVVGSLCAAGTEPRPAPSRDVLARLDDLAGLVAFILEERAMKAGRASALAAATRRAQEDFLALVNHELRMPLRASAELAEPPAPRRLGRDVVEALPRSGALMTRLVEGVLSHKELRSGSLVPREAVVPAERIVEAVRVSIAPRLKATGRPPPEIVSAPGLVLLGDPVLLGLALDCLVSEALADGHGPLRLSAAAGEDGGSLAVEESVSPPAPDDASASWSDVDAPGLMLTRRLIELHAGALSLEGGGERPRRAVLRLPRWRVVASP